ncbi:SMP-30/gluconolactonase/LRE family protein [Sulfitobacter sp. D35]|uniref:SMP-30/gluconolactonase/LRE family protein n=1 Tax=Sulfitobacter sp. D35 TaxID=3083252 RepID=UPI00296EA375|nr:L-dopachrome tautomerase-related protein [Sulfitobacter sp. D35]
MGRSASFLPTRRFHRLRHTNGRIQKSAEIGLEQRGRCQNRGFFMQQINQARRWPRYVAICVAGVVAIMLAGVLAIKLLFGMGATYPGLSGEPASQAIAEIALPLPPGMVAVGADGRVFFTYHPIHRPQDHVAHVLFEWRDGAALPIAPDLGERLHDIFGITVGPDGNIWAVRPGSTSGEATEVLAIDPDSGTIVFDFRFPDGSSPGAQDLRVSPDGRTVYLADTGFLRLTPAALVVLDVETRTVRRVLEDHPSTAPQNRTMTLPDGTPFRLFLGLVTFQVGVDGIALSADGEWLVYKAMTHDTVYRVPTAILRDPAATPDVVAAAVKTLGSAPPSDGIEMDGSGNVILTDVQSGGLARLAPDGRLTTLVRVPGVDWADSVSVAPNGDVWFTDSRLARFLDTFARPAALEDMQAEAPFYIYRVPAPD